MKNSFTYSLALVAGLFSLLYMPQSYADLPYYDRGLVNDEMPAKPDLLLKSTVESTSTLKTVIAHRVSPTHLFTMGFGDGKEWAITRDLIYRIGNTDASIVVPKGFVTDLASIPAIGAAIGLKKNGKYDRAAVLHDYLYWTQGCTREQADRLLVLAMKESDVAWFGTAEIYAGVHYGGKKAWANNAKDKQKGLPKIIPEQYLIPSDANETWSSYRDRLFKEGVRDPEFAKNPNYCAYGNSFDVPK